MIVAATAALELIFRAFREEIVGAGLRAEEEEEEEEEEEREVLVRFLEALFADVDDDDDDDDVSIEEDWASLSLDFNNSFASSTALTVREFLNTASPAPFPFSSVTFASLFASKRFFRRDTSRFTAFKTWLSFFFKSLSL